MKPLSFGFIAGGLPIQCELTHKQALGGAESSLLYVAQALAHRGHDVDVFANCPNPFTFMGVKLWPINQAISTIEGREFDVAVSVRNPSFLTMARRSRQHWLWLHDPVGTDMDMYNLVKNLWQTDAIIATTEYHAKSYYSRCQEIEPLCKVIPNPIPLTTIKEVLREDPRPKQNHFLWASCPERGLDRMLAMWPRIQEQFPNIVLEVCGYDLTPLMSPEIMAFRQKMKAQMDQTPGVVDLGILKKADFWRKLATARMLLYPTDTKEVFCLNVVEAMACGTPVVTTHHAGMAENLPYTGITTDPLTEEYEDAFVARVTDLMKNQLDYRRCQKDGVAAAQRFGLRQVSVMWEGLAHDLFERRRNSSPQKIFNRLVWNSDLVAARAFLDSLQDYEKEQPWVEKAQAQLKLDFAAHEVTHSNEESPESPYARKIPVEHQWEARSQESRLMPILGLLPSGSLGHVTDIAAGSGAVLAAVLDARGRDIEKAHAIDFSPKLCKQATKKFGAHIWGEKVQVSCGRLEDTQPNHDADVVIAGEILEHLIDPKSLTDAIRRVAKKGALVIITVPSGPWESIAWAKEGMSTYQRCVEGFHVHHYERQDILDLFGKQKGLTVQYVSRGRSAQGEELGNWIISYLLSNIPIGQVDYERKFLRTVPRETVAACLITRDAEADLTRCLQSLLPVVDEIHVCDNGSTDGTTNIVDWFSDLYSPRVFLHEDTPDPDGDGLGNFQTWRNNSIEHTAADWILWVDADEQLVGGEFLRQYLNAASLFNAYTIRQQNLQGVAKFPHDTERPQRVFRNGLGVQFIGVVHEYPYMPGHPHDVVPSVEMEEPDLLHFGYLSDGQVMFRALQRNIPLVQKDRKLNPDRPVGAYLEARDALSLAQQQIAQAGGMVQNGAVNLLRKTVKVYLAGYADPSSTYHDKALRVAQQALSILGNLRLPVEPDWGIPFEMELGVILGLGGLGESTDKHIEKRWFSSTQEFQDFWHMYETKAIEAITNQQGLGK